MSLEEGKNGLEKPAITEQGKDNSILWIDLQFGELLSRLPPAVEINEQVGALYQYVAWVNDIKETKFTTLSEQLPRQAYYLFTQKGGVEAVHKRTWLRGFGKEEAEARQSLERVINSHISQWKDHEGSVADLDEQAEALAAQFYIDY